MDVQTFIESEEGRRYVAYKDIFGNSSTGVGHLIVLPAESWMLLATLTDAQVDDIFAKDLAICTADCRDVFLNFNSLDEVRQAALQSAMFNLGKTRFLEFHNFINAMTRQDFDSAKIALEDSKADEELPGRYNQLGDMIQTGDWQ